MTGRRRTAARSERAAKLELEAFGIRVPKGGVARSEPQLVEVARTLAPPFVLKAHSEMLTHKSDVGGVELGIGSADEAVGALRRFRSTPGLDTHSTEVLLEEMAEPGLELIVGAACDPELGPLVLLGLGGVYVDVLQDVVMASYPLGARDAESMYLGLRGADVIRGTRGRPALDAAALVEVLLRIGGPDGLISAYLDRGLDVELDINPLILTTNGAIAADASLFVTPRPAPLGGTRGSGRGAPEGRRPLDPLFRPERIAVVGASPNRVTPGTRFIRALQEAGYEGEVVPVHPEADQIAGLSCVPTLGKLVEPADYAYVAVPAAKAVEVLAEGAAKVKVAQVMSSGFAETESGAPLQELLVEACRAGGARLVGPNCMGTHSPRGRVTFLPGVPMEPGGVGVISQSGGLGIDILSRGSIEGLRFSALCTIGNSADVGVPELLEHYLSDPETEVIGIYVEDLKDGRAFLDVLRRAERRKPIVVLRGGRTAAGRRVASSHTGALIGGDLRAWRGVARQFDLVMVDTLKEFLQAMLAFQVLGTRATLPPIEDVILFGNGGGASVLGADAVHRSGLSLRAFPPEVVRDLEALHLPPGTALHNPIDTPAGSISVRGGAVAEDILRTALGSGPHATVICHVNVTVLGDAGGGAGQIVEAILGAVLRAKLASPDHVFALVLRTDGDPRRAAPVGRLRQEALEAGIPVYPEVDEACRALAAVGRYRESIGGPEGRHW